MSDLTALLERVRAATGSDRRLDIDIGRLDTSGLHRNYRKDLPTDKILDALIYSEECDPPIIVCPKYTASIDAALALVERVLPDREWVVRCDAEQGAFANLTQGKPYTHEWVSDRAYAATAPLAILAALLTALIAQAGDRPAEDAP